MINLNKDFCVTCRNFMMSKKSVVYKNNNAIASTVGNSRPLEEIVTPYQPTPYAFQRPTGDNGKYPGRMYWAQFDLSGEKFKFICWMESEPVWRMRMSKITLDLTNDENGEQNPETAGKEDENTD